MENFLDESFLSEVSAQLRQVRTAFSFVFSMCICRHVIVAPSIFVKYLWRIGGPSWRSALSYDVVMANPNFDITCGKRSDKCLVCQAKEDQDKPGLVAILQKVLQLYAACLLSKRSYATKGMEFVPVINSAAIIE